MFEDMARRTAATLLLTVAFFSMALCQDMEKKPLHCYYCSYDEACAEIPVQCQEGEKCGTMEGRLDYKVHHHTIYGKGCVLAAKCGTQDRITYLDNPFHMTYSCCDTDYCNKVVLGLDHKGVVAAGHTPIPTHLPWLFATALLAALPAFLS